MPERGRREELLEALFRGAMRATGQSILFSDSIAERVGMNSTDLECLGFLAEEGAVTAGRLAEITGLTTGAATRMVDRLERAGYVKRVADPTDRRRVVVEPVAERIAALEPYYASLSNALGEAVEPYSDDQLALIVEFFGKTEQVMQTEIRKVKEQAVEPIGPREFIAPIAGAARGRLEFVNGVSHARIRAGTPEGTLCRAQFQGPKPKVRAQDGVVTVEYPRLSLADWARFALFERGHPAADVALTDELAWDLVCKGGASSCTAELSNVALSSLSIRGGGSQLEFTLGAPDGTVPLTLEGGASKVTVRRPHDVPVRLRIDGGATQVEFDGQRPGSAKSLDLKTPGWDDAAGRYDIHISGGVSQLRVERI